MEQAVEEEPVPVDVVIHARPVKDNALKFESPGRPPRLTEGLARALARVIVKAGREDAGIGVAGADVPDALAS